MILFSVIGRLSLRLLWVTLCELIVSSGLRVVRRLERFIELEPVIGLYWLIGERRRNSSEFLLV